MFSLHKCADFLSAPLEYPNASKSVTGISIDTRTLRPGDFFIALSGANQDGNLFLKSAMEKGASGALIDAGYWSKNGRESMGGSGVNVIPVKDTRQALVKLAHYHRSLAKIPFVGITGSVAKTSTKEFLSYLLARKLTEERLLFNRGNFNNELGLPLTLLRLNEEHLCAVTELGASKKGDIAFLCNILKPTAGILTCVAPCHLEGFGSLETVYDTKLELFDALPKGSPAVIPDDDEILASRTKEKKLSVVTVGAGSRAAFRVSNIQAGNGMVSFELEHGKRKRRFRFPGAAPFMAFNAAMAAAMYDALGYAFNEAPEEWNDLSLPQGRFSVQSIGEGITAVYDGYNASPKSFQKAIESFELMKASGRRVLVAADMLELGEFSEKYHSELGTLIRSSRLDAVFAYGPMTKFTIQRAGEESSEIHLYHSGSMDDIIKPLTDFLRPGDCVLLKASRGMKIDKVFDALKQHYSPENHKIPSVSVPQKK